MSYNHLNSLSSEIGQLTSLTSLDLSANQLNSLLPEIAQLTNLTSLNLASNKLSSLPPEISQLTSLTSLYLNNNQLSSLPPEIGQLTSLTSLYLVGNKLSGLPRQITQLVNLTSLYLSDNPLEFPPPEIIKQGVKAIKAYLIAIEAEITTRLFEAKLLIVGQGEVGKTCLMHRLIHNTVPETVTTEGIDINQWLLKTQQTDNFRVNVWDFGGQEIYHATHQFFLTKRSLYLFVWEARTDADLFFDYWLNTIKVLSDDSPVIVVQNKVDERRKPINEEGWKKRFPNIVGFFDVSALEGEGCEALKKAIIREIEQLPHIGDVLPKRWLDIRARLEGLKMNFITYGRYQQYCTEFEMDAVQTDRLSEYFHDLGVFLSFKENPILRHTVFLNPEWATNAVYKVTDDDEVKRSFGTFHFDQLTGIWSDPEEFPPEKHVELVELMKSFELCFELPQGRQYIIPELLRANQPNFAWNEADNLRFQYRYSFMPAGVMTRFIVVIHDLIKENLYWKDGVVLRWEQTEAVVVKTGPRLVEVWVRGHDRKTLLGMVRRQMAYIHSPFSNLEVNEMVPCICAECVKNDDPYFYPYQNLLKAREKGTRDIQCQKSFDGVSIEKLLGGIEDRTPRTEKEHKERAMKLQPRDIKIFLASSGELKAEREAIELFIGKENRRLRVDNTFLDLVIWEDLKQSFHGERIQDYFNEEMLKCDVVICLFFKKVGNFTKEEFELADENRKQGNKPRYLYIYFKSTPVDISEINPEDLLKISALKQEIEDKQQIYNQYTSIDNLTSQIKRQLEQIIPEIV